MRDKILGRQRPGSRVLVVEGDDDRQFIEAMLDQVAPGVWPTSWTLGEAGGKGNVQRILMDRPDWLALVDRDEWTEKDIVDKRDEFPGRLHVLPRYCLESYFILPSEIWAALPARQHAVPGGLPAMEAVLSDPAVVYQWVRHGCLWHAVNPLQAGLQTRGFKNDLLDLNRAQDDTLIRQTLESWHQCLDPDEIEKTFRQNLETATAAPLCGQLVSWVHGKMFFRQHVVPTLNGLFGQAAPDIWYTEMLKDLPRPPDLDFLWTAMGPI